ncbi:hypothetical protein HY333_01255 [Candidatus Collierbacteria bacterium]|nr:hypothetical protein [Candidatus Collierbacteria bacterium]
MATKNSSSSRRKLLSPESLYQRPPPLVPDSIISQGHQEAVKDLIKEADKNVQKFESIANRSATELYRLSTVFPFDFFPDTIIIDLAKVSLVTRVFFFTERIHSVFIQDILDVFIETSLFFATLNIVDQGFVENLITIRYLKKDQAIKARRIIQGLVVARKQGIELSALIPTSDLVSKLENIGSAR